jgi:hypothetical protein
MTETVHNDYEVSSEGGVRHWEIPYARLVAGTTPTPTNAAQVTGLLDAHQLTGTILTVDAGAAVAVIDFTPSMVYRFDVRNVLTYVGNAENTWGPINIGDPVYYDDGATMIAMWLQLSTAPASSTPSNNALFGYIVAASPADVFPKGGIVASTQRCAVMQLGAAAA